jgi:ATP-dependent RNA helicase RhlE
MTFSELRLAEPILRAVAGEGYSVPTPIQTQSIPHVLLGRDLLGCAQTGTGKTAAFALPIIDRLSRNARADLQSRAPRCLILCPTRELALQIQESFRSYGKHTRLTNAVIFGGVNQNPQVRALKAGLDVVVATPGRLLDLMNQGFVDLRAIEVLVLDEADRMLDMGFINDIRKIVAKVPHKRQTLLFSATMPGEIRRLAESLLRSPVSVQVAPQSATADNVAQSLYFISKAHKPDLLAHLINTTSISRALVFTRTKHGADRVVRHLHRAGITAEAIHGNKTQPARQRALLNFKTGKTHILVATDIAARGIDVDDISHVLNYDLPMEPETYIHRIGRTARAGASGIAVSFCDHEERGLLKQIERLIRKPIDVVKPDAAFAPSVTPFRDEKPEHAPRPMRTGGAGAGHGTRRSFAQPRRAAEAPVHRPARGPFAKHRSPSRAGGGRAR